MDAAQDISEIVYLQAIADYMGKRRITIYDLAKELDISAATVSRALANDPRVKEATKIKVQSLARRLKYQPNHIASALRKGRSKILGVLIPTSNSSIFSPVMHGVEEIANRYGYNVLFGQSHESFDKEVTSIQTFIRARIDGILVSVAKGTFSFEHFENLIQHDIPVVFFDRIATNLDTSSIEIDDYAAAVSAVDHLAFQGFRRIAHLAGPQHIRIYQNRRKGYEAGCKKHGLSIGEEYVYVSDLQLADGHAGAAQMMQLPKPPDAFFSASDDAAIGAIQFLRGTHYLVPQDVGVVGFANKEYSPYVSPPLTSIDQRSVEMGRKAAELLLAEINTERRNRIPKRLVLQSNLIIRSSSQRVNRVVPLSD